MASLAILLKENLATPGTKAQMPPREMAQFHERMGMVLLPLPGIPIQTGQWNMVVLLSDTQKRPTSYICQSGSAIITS